ncbi:ESF1 homolog [Myzus persicae]|uniref:ESF1 homolog n=1 Tax=Myzus persicae TaxID=13164 RepID=UPI000B9394FD|nr:ESF1 homolog [Myzus persicae]XP_022163921.1 ESF1 homolog [Myzus persicae]
MDKRFSKIGDDPKFRRVPKADRKVKIDKRFQSIFNDKRFKVKYTIDKRGKPLRGSTTDDFKKFYHMSDDEKEDTDAEQNSSDDIAEESESEEQTLVEEDDDDDDVKSNIISKTIKDRLKDKTVDYARGDGELMSDSSSDDDTSDEEKEENVEHCWGELDKDADNVEEATSRLALCNMDWDRIQAADLMILFNSFLPSDGYIKSVTIYPSDFGLKRMQEEELKGPPELISNNPKEIGSSDDSDQEEEEGGKFHMEKLRKYQLARLKYYYAIIVCDSPGTAGKLYTDCDGIEYESSATRLDLRFVPDDTEFDQEPKEVCDKLPDLTKYKPHLFTTTALQQAKVNLTWDETDPRRSELVNKLKTNPKSEINDSDLQNYVAFSSEDEDSDDESNKFVEENNEDGGSKKNPIDKYKELLQNIQDEEEKKASKDSELEISWGIGLQEKVQKSVDEKSKKNMTPFQKMMEKKKERMKEKQKLRKETNETKDNEIDSENENKQIKQQAELELLLMDEEPSEKQHFNMKKIQEEETKSSKKKNKKKNLNEKSVNDAFSVDVKDDRFSALYTSHLFNIDPADPKFKRTKGMEEFISEKATRRQQYDMEKVDIPPKKKSKQSIINPELSNLVKSIKSKTKHNK